MILGGILDQTDALIAAWLWRARAPLVGFALAGPDAGPVRTELRDRTDPARDFL